MFEQYLKDAFYFFSEAENKANKASYYRASIFHLASAVEAYVNYIAYSFDQGNFLETKTEINFLNDRLEYVDAKTGTTEIQKKYNSVDDKLKYLVNRFTKGNAKLVEEACWSGYKNFKKFRDELVHPKEGTPEITDEDYKSKTEKGLRDTIILIDKISKSIFDRGLRPGILDYIP